MNRRPPKNGEKQMTFINTLLIDGNALFKFSLFGAKNEYNSQGIHIGGLYSFLIILRKLLNEDLYHRVYVFWDGNLSGKLRYNIYEDYKKNRDKDYINGTKPIDESELNQRKLVWEYLNELNIRQLMDDVVETDDFIAYYCLKKQLHENLTIVSSDRDFLQLIDEKTRMYVLDLKTYVDANNFSNYFHFRRENAMLVKILTGDNSDNIKGVKGLKIKTLLKMFPELVDKKLSLSEIIEIAKEKQEVRLKEKKKPFKVLNNIINGVTDGIQKERIYEINEKLINLKKPLITESAINELDLLINGTFDDSQKELKNVFKMMRRDGLDKSMGQNLFNDFLLPFKKLMHRETINE